MVTRVRIYGDSLAYGQGIGFNQPDTRRMVYSIGYGLGLTDSQIVNNGVSGSGIADALLRQKNTPAGGPGSLDILLTGHNDVRPIPTTAIVQSIKDGYSAFYTYARSNGGDALMLGMVNGEGYTPATALALAVQDINAYIVAAFPAADRFISYEYMCRQIGPDATCTVQCMLDAGMTPTADDRTDILGGWTPINLRAANGTDHWNQIGQDTYAARLVRHINSGTGPPVAGYTGSLAASPTSPGPGVSVTFTATVTPAPAKYQFRLSDGTVRAYAVGDTATATMGSVPLTAILDVQDASLVNTTDLAALTVQSTPPPASVVSAGFLPFFANA